MVAIYRDPSGIRLKGQKGIYWLVVLGTQEPSAWGRQGEGRVSGVSGEKDTQPRALLIPASRAVLGWPLLGFLLSLR